MIPLIDYKDFLSKRFDLVVRYHILREVDFDFHKAITAITTSKDYAFLREVYKTLALPIVEKMTRDRLWERFKDRLDLYMAHNLFPIKQYLWIEQAMKTEHWQYAEPYGVRSKGHGVPTKRFLVALKLNKPLRWQQGGWANSYKQVSRPTRIKQNYKKLLPPKKFAIFECTEEDMMQHMEMLEFFSKEFQLEAPLIEYKKFLEKRYDLVIRYLLLEQTDFNVREAQQLWEVKRAKGKPVVVKGASDKYNFLDRMLRGKKFFDLLRNWDYIDVKVRKEKNWLRYNPYIVTTSNIGISIKRFFAALKYEKFLYWIQTDVYNKKYNERINQAPWSEELYKKCFSKKEIGPFDEAKFRLMARMSKLNFFCESTKVGGLTNEHLSLRDIPNR